MYKILLIILVLFNISSYSQDAPKTKLYAVSDGSCCGGEESDPHAVHGIEAINNGFILSGKSIDQNGTEEGFVVKFPSNMPDEKIFLHPEDEYSFDWTFTFGSQGKRDGANGSAIIDNSVFVSGYSENEKGVINKYLAMLDLVDGKLKWEKFYQSKNKNSAFESILATSDNGIILSGVNNADKESFEGFKSYGNPQSGEAFVMFFDKNSLIAENGPSKATWEITIKNSISGITIKENIKDKTFVIASASTKEPRIAKITKIDKNGKIIWNKSYPNLAEITDLDISYNNENPDGYLISGHKSDTYDGIDGTLTKLSLDGSIIWNNMFGNPIGGNNKFSSVTDKNEKMVFDECWGISSTLDGGAVMACGTGKTFTSLKIAEAIANKKLILYMVPSLALMSQSIREWKNDCVEDFIAFSACSDKKVGKVKDNNDQIQIKLNELAIPATTESKKLAEEINRVEKNKMVVVFSTYQSIDVIAEAQKKFSLNSFDLIICDEAHRTTGATFEDQEDSYFVRIHDNKYVKGKKRLYMTATPRIFGSKAKKKADEGSVELASMDDPEKFGEEFFNRGFNWAVENNLLSDYKVVILAVDEALVSSNLQKSFEDGSELKLTDATKIIGVYKALAKVGFDNKKNEKLKPIRKALAFTQSIEISKIFEKEFSNVINEYEKNENIKKINKLDLNVEAKHIDGTFNAERRNDSLNWLKSKTEENTCRILSNVKCLSEGVDVPSLDAIMFLHPKKSQIDVVQAVGRVMRKAEGKDLGYVIIPVTVAPGVSPEKALNDNEKY